MVTTYHGPDEDRRRRENRGNQLLARFLKDRYSYILVDETDCDTVLEYLDSSGTRQGHEQLIQGLAHVERYEFQDILDTIGNNADLRADFIRLLCFVHFVDVPYSHTVPLASKEFKVPEPVNFNEFQKFLNTLRNTLI